MCLPRQGVTYSLSLGFFCSLTSVPFTSFQLSTLPARSCPGLSYSDMFYSQVLLRRLHGSCARVCVCLCPSACVCLRPCRPCGVNPLTCSGCARTATEPYFLQHTTAALQVLHSNRTSELATHTQKCIVANCHSTHLEKLHRYPGIDFRLRRIQCNPNMHARRLPHPPAAVVLPVDAEET
jgi:hypothetical protein